MSPTSSLPSRRWASLGDAADYLGIHPRTLRRMIAAGTVRAYRSGPRLIRLDLAELDAALRPIPTTGDAA